MKSDGHFPKARGKGSQVSGPSGHQGQTDLEERYTKGETVAVWLCAPGCPVAALDDDSGVLHSQDPATRKGRPGKHGTGGGTTYLSVKETGNHYADKGGASRFFKQVGGEAIAASEVGGPDGTTR